VLVPFLTVSKVYDTNTYGLVGHVALYIDADSRAYDPETKIMYVVSGGREAEKQRSTHTLLLHQYGGHDAVEENPRLENRCKLAGGPRPRKGWLAVVRQHHGRERSGRDRPKPALNHGGWPIPANTQQNLPLLLHDPNHRLLLTTRKSPKLVVIDSESGKVRASVPCVGMVDDIAYDAKLKGVYLSGD